MKNLIKNLAFFKDKNIISIDEIIYNKRYFLKTDKLNYNIVCYPKSQIENIKREYEILKEISKIENDFINIDSYEVFGNFAFKIYIHEKENEDEFSKKEIYEYGYKIGNIIKKIINISDLPINDEWSKKYSDKIEYILCRYEKRENKGYKDYIIIDYIKKYKHIIQNKKIKQIFVLGRITDVKIYKNGRIDIINNRAYDNSDLLYRLSMKRFWDENHQIFISGVLNGIYDNKPSNLVFKIWAFYSFVEVLKYFLGEDININEDERLVIELDLITKDYNMMDNIIPNWYKDGNYRGD